MSLSNHFLMRSLHQGFQPNCNTCTLNLLIVASWTQIWNGLTNAKRSLGTQKLDMGNAKSETENLKWFKDVDTFDIPK